MKNPLVFSYVREQSLFMTAIMSLLTFLSILALGVALSIGTGVARWNVQWDLFATVQIMPGNDVDAARKIIDENAGKISAVKEISKKDMEKMMRPWMSGGSAHLENYLPLMYELKFKNKSDIKPFQEKISRHARFLTHSAALKSATGAGWRMVWISGFVLLLVLGTIGVCISYIARNTALLHKRELEILNQVGAADSFIARQMQIIVAKICLVSGLAGFFAAAPVLALILSAAKSARVGLMAMIGLNSAGWISLAVMPIAIIIFSIWITKKATFKILENN
ncbi:MAG: hypothetical protein LBD50_03520 [Rickettsiales bacterium]|jgi:cell division protein FtsX|nr:hypothetical protein [Rickettsiales bacterium]